MVSYSDMCYIMGLISGGPETPWNTITGLKALYFSFRKENNIEIEQAHGNFKFEAVLFKVNINFFPFMNEMA